jgi:pyruvate/2-oxoglutarate dehydrogenase complex dihydrolipoamide dehydrogenase (E3) component
MNNPPTFDLIVIGGGPAGSTAALRARELGASVALVERGAMGGACTNDGCVPTRVLARAARLMAVASQYADYGMEVAQPVLDFQRLLARAQAIVYQIHEKKQLVSHLEAAGATVYAGVGEASFVDPHTIALPDGRQLHGEKFILAAGGRARRLDFPGEELALTHSDIWRLQKLPRSVAIVGGAATGCQLAAIFNAFGSQVTVLDVAPRILTAEDSLVSQAMTEAFQRRGIDVLAGISGIAGIERAGGELALVYKLGEAAATLRAEAVVLSTGWLGNLDGLNLPAAGVETNGRYVVADDTCRTSAPHIFASGDIDGRMMLVQSAGPRGEDRGRERGAGRAGTPAVPNRAPRRLHQPRIRQRRPDRAAGAPRARRGRGGRFLRRPGPGRDRRPHRRFLQADRRSGDASPGGGARGGRAGAGDRPRGGGRHGG